MADNERDQVLAIRTTNDGEWTSIEEVDLTPGPVVANAPIEYIPWTALLPSKGLESISITVTATITHTNADDEPQGDPDAR